MSEIDDLKDKVSALDTSVQANTDAVNAAVAAFESIQDNSSQLQAEIDQLRADDSIEDSQLEGIQDQADEIKRKTDAATAALRAATPGDTPPA